MSLSLYLCGGSSKSIYTKTAILPGKKIDFREILANPVLIFRGGGLMLKPGSLGN